jgi:nucleoside-diphosphate-sugar epimerase
MTRLLARDLDDLIARYEPDFIALRGKRLFVTGGTGFVGSWLLESFTWANARLALGASAVVLARDPNAFRSIAPHLAHDPALEFLAGDVRALPALGAFDGVIHAAAPASKKLNDEEPLAMLETIVEGTRGVLEMAARSGPIPVLLTSSGAVYGRQPPELERFDETYTGAPDTLDARNAYHEGKRLAELLGAVYAQTCGLHFKLARLFAFVGPYLPLDRHFAIGNFIGDALAGRTIEVRGDGTPVRSYLYGGDMAGWLWAILSRGRNGRAYNVGSSEAVDIAATAHAVASAVDPTPTVTIRGTPDLTRLPERYVPSVARAFDELSLVQTVDLPSAIGRTIAWHEG